VFLAGNAHADPIHVATVQADWLINHGQQLMVVDLAENPDAVLAGQRLVFPEFGGAVRRFVGFDVILPFRQVGTLRRTFTWPAGWAPPFGFLDQQVRIDGTDLVGFSLDFPIVYHPVPVTLTLSQPGVPGGGIVGPSTFTFSVVSPTPEPPSIVLWLGALVAAILVHPRSLGAARSAASS
jgi:hypothetical protein